MDKVDATMSQILQLLQLGKVSSLPNNEVRLETGDKEISSKES